MLICFLAGRCKRPLNQSLVSFSFVFVYMLVVKRLAEKVVTEMTMMCQVRH